MSQQIEDCKQFGQLTIDSPLKKKKGQTYACFLREELSAFDGITSQLPMSHTKKLQESL